jgi:hypothetical protein
MLYQFLRCPPRVLVRGNQGAIHSSAQVPFEYHCFKDAMVVGVLEFFAQQASGELASIQRRRQYRRFSQIYSNHFVGDVLVTAQMLVKVLSDG